MLRCPPVLVLAAALALSGCGSEKVASPTSPSNTSTVTAVTVAFAAGHPPTLQPGETLRLLASASLGNGATQDCTSTAVWSTSNEAILRFTGRQPGEVIALVGGEVTISATCSSIAGTLKATVLTVTSVVIAMAPGHAATLTIGERSQLSARASLSDGSSLDCTAVASWSSSNSGVASMLAPAGTVQGGSSGVATIEAVCGGIRGTIGIAVGPGVRITGLEEFPYFVLLQGNTEIRAARVDAAGSVIRDCSADATWSSSDSAVARVVTFAAVLGTQIIKGREGEATLTAMCDGVAGQIRVRIGHYTLKGTVRSAAGSPLVGAYAVGSYTDAQGAFAVDLSSEPSSLTFAHVGFELLRRDMVWNRQPTMIVDLTMTPLPGLFRQGERTLCTILSGGHDAECAAASAVMQDVIDFTVPRIGLLRLSAFWRRPVGSNEGLLVNLTCNGVRDPRLPIVVQGAEGGGFTIPADTSCQYRLTVQNASRVTVLPYQFSLSIE